MIDIKILRLQIELLEMQVTNEVYNIFYGEYIHTTEIVDKHLQIQTYIENLT